MIILAGDHLYRMDYSELVQFHVEMGADITLAVQPVSAKAAPALGIFKRGPDGEILSFTEKPARDELDGVESMSDAEKPYMASMGIYVFSTQLLFELLEAPGDDFGKEIIPAALPDRRVMGYVIDDFWADIGTIRRFYEVNLELVSPDPPFDLNVPHRPIYTHARFLPPCESYGSDLDGVLLGDGCRVRNSRVTNSVIGLRGIVGPDAVLESSVMMGSDY